MFIQQPDCTKVNDLGSSERAILNNLGLERQLEDHFCLNAECTV